MKFYVGLHQPTDAKYFERAFISVKRTKRYRTILANEWIMDSGAFSEISMHGHYRSSVREYADEINRWAGSRLIAAVSQDWMCEPHIVKRTGLTVRDHQELTIERYLALKVLVPLTYVMPVLQGYTVDEYLEHLEMYGSLLRDNNYVGLGSVCKRNTNVSEIETIITAIKSKSPSLKLHGFGIKLTSLKSPVVRENLFSADSMAWSFSARKKGRNPNDWREAKRFEEKVNCLLS